MANQRSRDLEMYSRHYDKDVCSKTLFFCVLCCYDWDRPLSKISLEARYPNVCENVSHSYRHKSYIPIRKRQIVHDTLKIFYGLNSSETTVPPFHTSGDESLEPDPNLKPVTEYITNIIGNTCSGVTTYAQSLPNCKLADELKWGFSSTMGIAKSIDYIDDDDDVEDKTCWNMYAYRQQFLLCDQFSNDSPCQELGVFGVMADTIFRYFQGKITKYQLWAFFQSITSLNLSKYELIYVDTHVTTCFKRMRRRDKVKQNFEYKFEEICLKEFALRLVYIFHSHKYKAKIVKNVYTSEKHFSGND